MKIIFVSSLANPVYDKMTVSRAAHAGHPITCKSAGPSRQLNRSREITMVVALKSEDHEQTTITVRIRMKNSVES